MSFFITMKPKNSPFIALKEKNFALFSLGLLVSRIGDEMQNVVIHWQIYILTKSPLALGMIGFSKLIPLFLFSLFGGIAADKFDRQRILVYSQIGKMLISAYLTYATFAQIITPQMIYIAIGLQATIDAFDVPSRQSIIPHLVSKEHFPNAVSLNSTFWQAAIVVGPGIGGLIIDGFGSGMVHLVNTISYFAIIFSLLIIKIHKIPTKQEISFSLQSMLDGFRFVWRTPILSATMLLDFFATFFASASTLMPIFAKEIFRVGASGLGLLYSAPSIGGIITGLVFSTHQPKRNHGKLLFFTVLVYGFASIMFSITTSFYIALAILAVSGACDILSAIIRVTLRQMVTPDHMRGRMTSVNRLFVQGGPLLGELEAGFVASLANARVSMGLGGIGTIISTLLIVYKIPQILRYQGHEFLEKNSQ